MIDFQLTEDHEAIRQTVRDFALFQVQFAVSVHVIMFAVAVAGKIGVSSIKRRNSFFEQRDADEED